MEKENPVVQVKKIKNQLNLCKNSSQVVKRDN